MGNLGIRRPSEWGVDPTPEKVRILRTFDLFIFWSSLAVGLLVFTAGTLLVLFFGLSLLEVLVACIVGSVVGSLLLAGAGIFGAKFGVPTMVSLRPILGIKGSYVPSVLNIFQLVGWTSFELYIMGLAATQLSGSFFGDFTMPFWIGVFAIVVIVFAIGGPLVVIRNWLEKVAIWFILISTAIIAYQIFAHPIAWNLGGNGKMLLAIDLVIAMPISWWPLISDYNRFAKSPKHAVTGTALGYTVSNFVFFFLGAAMIVATMTDGVITAIGSLGLGSMILLLILVDETDNAFADVYSAAVTFQNIRKKTKQIAVIGVATLISSALAIFLSISQEPIGGGYESFLLLIGALFVPLLGIVIADYFIVRRGRYDISEFYTMAPRMRWQAFAAWIPGIILYYLLSPSLVSLFVTSFEGLPFTIGASLPSFILSAGLYLIISKICPLRLKYANPERV